MPPGHTYTRDDLKEFTSISDILHRSFSDSPIASTLNPEPDLEISPVSQLE